MNKKHKFNKPKSTNLLIILFVTYILISLIVKFDILFFIELPNGLSILLDTYFPPMFEETAEISNIIKAIWDTLLISAAATSVGALTALFITLLSINDMKYNIFGYIAKVTAAITRNIPAYIWGLFFVFMFWYGEYVAYMALAIATYGFLVRAFSEVVNNTGKHSIEALKATGATNWQIITRAIVPGSLPLIFSWSLYSFELNVRGATIVALVTNTGLGGLLQTAKKLPYRSYPYRDNYQMAIIFGIAFMVIVIDIFVSKVRARLLKWD